jgi:hypothetical protein
VVLTSSKILGISKGLAEAEAREKTLLLEILENKYPKTKKNISMTFVKKHLS